MGSERLERELAKFPKPWQEHKEYDCLADANGNSIPSYLLLYYIGELESIREVQARIIQELRT